MNIGSYCAKPISWGRRCCTIFRAQSGLLKSARDVASNKTYYEVTGKDAFGHTTTAKFTQAGVTLSRTYSAETGRLQSIAATDVIAGTLQNISVSWGSLGNLQNRSERINGSTTNIAQGDNSTTTTIVAPVRATQVTRRLISARRIKG